MIVFLSWSNRDSNQLAETLKKWLTTIFSLFNVDIEFLIAEATEESLKTPFNYLVETIDRVDFTILCLTPSNYDSVWISYDAGALWKLKDKRFVAPVILGSDSKPMRPVRLSHDAFQADAEGIKSLIYRINWALDEVGQNGIPSAKLDSKFDEHLPFFLNDLAAIELEYSKKIGLGITGLNYSLTATRFGIGHNKVSFYCEISDDGSPSFRRNVEIEAFSNIDSVDTYLLGPILSDSDHSFSLLQVGIVNLI